MIGKYREWQFTRWDSIIGSPLAHELSRLTVWLLMAAILWPIGLVTMVLMGLLSHGQVWMMVIGIGVAMISLVFWVTVVIRADRFRRRLGEVLRAQGIVIDRQPPVGNRDWYANWLSRNGLTVEQVRRALEKSGRDAPNPA